MPNRTVSVLPGVSKGAIQPAGGVGSIVNPERRAHIVAPTIDGTPVGLNIDVAGDLTGALVATAADGIVDDEFASLSPAAAASATLGVQITVAGALAAVLAATVVDGLVENEFGALEPSSAIDASNAIVAAAAGALAPTLDASAAAAIGIDAAGSLTATSDAGTDDTTAAPSQSTGGPAGLPILSPHRRSDRVHRTRERWVRNPIIYMAGALEPTCEAHATAGIRPAVNRLGEGFEGFSIELLVALLEAV